MMKIITRSWLLGVLLATPLLAEARDQLVQKQIRLSATIPADEVSSNLVSYPLDGDFKRLFYNTDTQKFNDIWFYVRTETELSNTPGAYSFIQTYNNLSCYGGSTSDVVKMIIKINNQPMSSDGYVSLNEPDLWYRGADKYYSDVPIEMSSPTIYNDVTKWCTGQVSLIVMKNVD